jgi:DNA-binding beta-propeller fold protein YncE
VVFSGRVSFFPIIKKRRGDDEMMQVLKSFLVLTILFAPFQSFCAESVKFRHVLSIYLDEKGSGMKQPEGVAWSETSHLVVADTGNGRLLQFTVQDRTVKGGKEIKIAQLPNPIGVEVNSKGEIFALDGRQRRIIRISTEGEYKGYLQPEGIPSPSSFVPKSFRIDSRNNIYILDIFSARVLVLAPDGKYQWEVEFPKEIGFLSDLTIDFKDNIMLIDSIKKMVFIARKGSKGFTPLTKNLKEYLNFPTAITTDNRGTIYVVDKNGSGVVILGQDGSYLGRQLAMGWNEGMLYYPSQMRINEKGEVFIADRGNSRVQIFTLVK